MRRLSALLLTVVAVTALPRPGVAQNVCNLVYQQGGWSSTGPEGQRIINAGGPLNVRCANGEDLRADSAVMFEAINEVHLFGRVDYQDPTRALTSDYATYNGSSGRLWATGNVVFTDKNRGSTLRGPNLEYFRAGAGRPQAQAIATERPHLTVVPSTRGRQPMEIDGNRITTVGEQFMTAEGNVVIDGKEMDAWANEAYYDAVAERMELRGNARAKGEQYELSADYIESHLAQGAIDRVLARGSSRLVQEKLRITGPQLQMFFARDSLQRLVSGNSPDAKGRSVALARGFRMEADSLEALTPGQRVRQVTAIGKAAGQSWDTLQVSGPTPQDAAGQPDTVAGLSLGQRDLLFGDTIIGYFRSDSALAASRPAGAPADTSRDAELERLLALGSARSLYRLAPSRDSAQLARSDGRRGINYLIGDTIDLAFAEGEVDVATVRGLKRGVYLEPNVRDTARADSARGDSAAARVAERAPGAVRPAGPAPTGGQQAPPGAPAAAPPGTTPPPDRRRAP
jgi:lipopolysaccharide export system protein LptA